MVIFVLWVKLNYLFSEVFIVYDSKHILVISEGFIMTIHNQMTIHYHNHVAMDHLLLF